MRVVSEPPSHVSTETPTYRTRNTTIMKNVSYFGLPESGEGVKGEWEVQDWGGRRD